MAHFPRSRLSRQELYSYGFREGEPWGDDRRALESALLEMDQLEREIQQNYIYARPTPSNSYASPAAIPRYMNPTPSGYLSPGRYPTPDIRIARSDASDGSSEVSSVSPYSGRGYDYSTGYRDPVNYGSIQPGWHQPSPANFQRSPSGSPVPQNFQSFPERYFATPPPSISPSTSRNFHSIEDPSQRPSAPAGTYYGSRASNTSRSSNGGNAPAQLLSPSQMQLVTYNNGQATALDFDDPPEEVVYNDTSSRSPQWSMDATRGTSSSERSMSATSQGIYPEGSPLSGFSDVTRSSGYVESYDVASYGDYRDHLPDSEDEREYMSDDIASNEGEYYSSGEEPEYGDEGDDVYSDGGYSDSYDDGSYGSD